MIALLFRLMTALALMFVAAPAMAQQRHLQASLVPAASQAAPGETLPLAVLMKPDRGWHGYWSNPGDAGAEPRIEWTLPEGYGAAKLRYPVPDRLLVSNIMNYVYEHDYALLTELRVPEDAEPGTIVPLSARLDYLVCSDTICVPESADIAAEIRVGATAAKSAAFDRYEAALPRPLDSKGRFEIEGDMLRIGIPVPQDMAVTGPYFFADKLGMVSHSAEQVISRNGDMIVIETQPGQGIDRLRSLSGVLSIGGGQGLHAVMTRGDVPAAGRTIARGPEPLGWRAVPAALIGAILGGLLLNIMPCVFPILSLKALSLAKAGGNERAAKREGLAYTAGVILVCTLLGGALLGVREAGVAAGWAFQLQNPRVILFLLLLVGGIALNLAGLFELPSLSGGSSLAGRGGTQGAFWTGALAAFVATPCTGPFMGAALGAALVLPAPAALAVFAGLGLGLALPFLLLGFVPALRRALPKPGAWMVRFRHILAIPMALTALGLAWVLWRQAGGQGLLLGIGALVLVSLCLVWLGRRQGRGGAWLPLGPAAAVAIAALVLLPTDAPASVAEQAIGGEPFSEARLVELRAEGRPVFLYFTADWCITCKVNEKGAMASEEVAAAFEKGEVAVLVGDWTRGDADIGRFLAEHGRSGVPLYLYYAPGKEAEVLPQILTTAKLTSLVS